jgi:hypothetical protein
MQSALLFRLQKLPTDQEKCSIAINMKSKSRSSMPVRFSGTPPKPGSEVVVRGQLAKESNG